MSPLTETETAIVPSGPDFVKYVLEESWTYIRTVVDIVREPILILDKDLRVRAANESFYRTFQVDPKETESQIVYDLGNGQWDIPALRKLLDDILPKNTFFKGFEVAHDFPIIGRKVMILNARQIHFKESGATELFPSIILLAMEDVTEMMVIAESLASHANKLEARFADKTKLMSEQIVLLEGELKTLKAKK